MISVAGWAAARKTQNCEAEAASEHTRKIPTFSRRLARQSHYPRRASRSFSAAKHATAMGCDRGRGLGAQLEPITPGAELDVASRMGFLAPCGGLNLVCAATNVSSAACNVATPLVNFFTKLSGFVASHLGRYILTSACFLSRNERPRVARRTRSQTSRWQRRYQARPRLETSRSAHRTRPTRHP